MVRRQAAPRQEEMITRISLDMFVGALERQSRSVTIAGHGIRAGLPGQGTANRVV
jgi:hypothetical protein